MNCGLVPTMRANVIGLQSASGLRTHLQRNSSADRYKLNTGCHVLYHGDRDRESDGGFAANLIVKMRIAGRVDGCLSCYVHGL